MLWWSGVVVSALALINEVNQCRARLVLRRVTVSGFNSRSRTFISATQANSAFPPSGVGKWVPALAGKAKAGMVHSVSGWTRGVQVKLWDPLRMRGIPERLRGVFTTRRYTNTRLPYLTLPYMLGHYTVSVQCACLAGWLRISLPLCRGGRQLMSFCEWLKWTCCHCKWDCTKSVRLLPWPYMHKMNFLSRDFQM